MKVKELKLADKSFETGLAFLQQQEYGEVLQSAKNDKLLLLIQVLLGVREGRTLLSRLYKFIW